MIYRTTDRFPSMTTEKPDQHEVESIVIDAYKTDTELTNENLAKPFEQIQEALRKLHIGGDNERGVI